MATVWILGSPSCTARGDILPLHIWEDAGINQYKGERHPPPSYLPNCRLLPVLPGLVVQGSRGSSFGEFFQSPIFIPHFPFLKKGISQLVYSICSSLSRSKPRASQEHKMSAPAKYFKVTQLKSTIGLPRLYKDTLETLGLRRRHQTVYHKITPQQAGQIARVKELVKVELSPVYKDKAQMRAERKPLPGFVVVKRRA